MARKVTVDPGKLTQFSAKVLQKVGVPEEDAAIRRSKVDPARIFSPGIPREPAHAVIYHAAVGGV